MSTIIKFLYRCFFPPFVPMEHLSASRGIRTFAPLNSAWGLRRGERALSSIAFFSIFITFTAHALFDYDLAISQSQKGNLPEAAHRLQKVLTHQPDRTDVLYDSGVSAFKNKEFDIALAYFNKAAQNPKAPQELREHAYFNSGNTHVELKQLQEAIDAYDKVLELNPQHEKAKHNKEVVKKMLEQQKQEEQKDKNKDQDKEEENKQDNQDQDQKDQQSADDKSMADRDQKDKQQQQQNSDQKQQEDKNQQNKQNQESADAPADAKSSGGHGKAQADKDKREKQKRDQEQQKQEQAQQKALRQAQDEKNKGSGSKEQSGAQNLDRDSEQKLSAALEHALKEHEKKDAQLNKQMIKAMAGSQTGASNGSNCW